MTREMRTRKCVSLILHLFLAYSYKFDSKCSNVWELPVRQNQHSNDQDEEITAKWIYFISCHVLVFFSRSSDGAHTSSSQASFTTTASNHQQDWKCGKRGKSESVPFQSLSAWAVWAYRLRWGCTRCRKVPPMLVVIHYCWCWGDTGHRHPGGSTACRWVVSPPHTCNMAFWDRAAGCSKMAGGVEWGQD